MAAPPDVVHTYGPGCRLAPVPFPRDGDAALEDIPPLKAQFFYSSLIPINDSPLSAASDLKSSSTSHTQRPFSEADNNALERAWLSFASDGHRRTHSRALRNRSPSPGEARRHSTTVAAICRRLAQEHTVKHRRQGLAHSPAPFAIAPTATAAAAAAAACCAELPVEAEAELRGALCTLARRRLGTDTETVVASVMATLGKAAQDTGQAVSPASNSVSPSVPAPVAPPSRNLPAARIPRPGLRSSQGDGSASSQAGTGRDRPIPHASHKPLAVRHGAPGKPVAEPISPASATSEPTPVRASTRFESQLLPEAEAWERAKSVEIPVGSRLYLVSIPELQMRPIYWSPINDITVVSRSTWFYRDTMAPVEPKVANQLEAGYRELRPWSEAWSIEIRCAVEVGALGEEKVTLPLWGEPCGQGRAGEAERLPAAEPEITDDPYCAARCFRGSAAAVGALGPPARESVDVSTRSYASWHVLYKNGIEANLLKPSLRPSAYYNRTPVSRIMKGTTVGIPVVRGFDREAWRRIHERSGNHGHKTDRRHMPADTSTHATSGPQTGPPDLPCTACTAEAERWRDLVLVIHGIGQKFAERVESFHFTHAINGFRRAVNAELGNDKTRGAAGGIMVLPVNWRHLLSFEDGGPVQQSEPGAAAPADIFGLKDIEPDSIPAVRSLISDVMFDVPYYLSHHKPRMIKAVTREANRIWRLWCRYNPGFVDQGRVHLIAHSLGSVMALEVLSNQPTHTPPLRLPCADANPGNTHFEFDSKNLFLLGSPAGFFLLLERAQLVPREGRLKPGADPADVTSKKVVGQQGQFGCLAVDNVYNILAREDPVAYFLNGTIDSVYAASLRKAYVPTTATLFQSIGNGIRGLWGAAPGQSGPKTPSPLKPPTMRLPSQLELEVHDFTREEIAERKAFLLNDNGQIDFTLHSGGGPLEIQYLNMLHAHSSYWTSPDLIRMLCMEIGRKPGRSNTYASLRATKITKRIISAGHAN